MWENGHQDDKYSIRLFEDTGEDVRGSKVFDGSGELKSYLDDLRRSWNNSGRAYAVIAAVEKGDYKTLVEIIKSLVEWNVSTKEELDRTRQALIEANKKIEELEKSIQGAVSCYPADKGLDIEKMILLYNQYHSFEEVGRQMNVCGKTVKRRLKKAGHID